MIKLVVTIFFIIFTANASATAQYPDILIYKGKTISIFTNPLELYFDKNHAKPKIFSKTQCTAIWRGYIATWEIKNNTLYLSSLTDGSCGEDPSIIPLNAIFKEKKTPIKASWFSGVIRVPFGKRIQYVHMGYNSVYEKELYLTIKKGNILKIELQERNKITEKEFEQLEDWKKLK
ncbi:MAG: hypothetical protein KAH03_07940 [Cocleimonas sp.]|nr:hypothetical protein [Cocleimonas sp.]